MNTLTHYQVTAELMTDEKGSFIELSQQDGFKDPASVYLHPWQLKAIQQELGLISTDQEATKKIATLERRLLALRNRVETLHDYLCNNSDHKHADLTWEVVYATATVDIANEFCVDFEPVQSDVATKEAA
jgi:hypothetical protein